MVNLKDSGKAMDLPYVANAFARGTTTRDASDACTSSYHLQMCNMNDWKPPDNLENVEA